LKKTFIYLIESVDNFETIYKIGHTKNKPYLRVRQLQTGTGANLKLVCSFGTEYGTKLEVVLHNMFKSKQVRNEWFRLDLDDVINFTKFCEMYEANIKMLSESDNIHFNKWMKK